MVGKQPVRAASPSRAILANGSAITAAVMALPVTRIALDGQAVCRTRAPRARAPPGDARVLAARSPRVRCHGSRARLARHHKPLAHSRPAQRIEREFMSGIRFPSDKKRGAPAPKPREGGELITGSELALAAHRRQTDPQESCSLSADQHRTLREIAQLYGLSRAGVLNILTGITSPPVERGASFHGA